MPKVHLLSQAAGVPAELFNFDPPSESYPTWHLPRLFEQKPPQPPVPVTPTREYCLSLFEAQIKAIINDKVTPKSEYTETTKEVVSASAHHLLSLQWLLPTEWHDNQYLYRLVLDHGDYGGHNMSITTTDDGLPQIASIYGWEMGYIVPAILSDPRMTPTVKHGYGAMPAISDVSHGALIEGQTAHGTAWSDHYFGVLFDKSPSYEVAILQGKYARHIWFSLRDWRGDDPAHFFSELACWAISITHGYSK